MHAATATNGCTTRVFIASCDCSTNSRIAAGVLVAGADWNRTRDRPSAYVSMMSTSCVLYWPASSTSGRHIACNRRIVSSDTVCLPACSWINFNASRYPRTSCSLRSRNTGLLPNNTAWTRFASIVTPSIRFDEIALSIIACSRNTFNFCGDCFRNNSCFPRASPRSARYHPHIAGSFSTPAPNWRNVIMPMPHYACPRRESSTATPEMPADT